MSRAQIVLIVALLLVIVVIRSRQPRRTDDLDWPEDDPPAASEGRPQPSSGADHESRPARRSRTQDRPGGREPGSTGPSGPSWAVACRSRLPAGSALADGIFEPRQDTRGAVFAQVKEALDAAERSTRIAGLLSGDRILDAGGGWLQFDGNRWIRANPLDLPPRLRRLRDPRSLDGAGWGDR